MHLQRLYGPQRGEGPLGDGLQLVVVEREQVEVVQVLEGVHAQTRNLICIQQPGRAERRDGVKETQIQTRDDG